MRIFTLPLVAIFFLAGAFPALAEEDLGPAIGSAIPHDLSVNGGPSFDGLTGEKGMVLFFIRSVNWCPYCKAQVIDVSSRHDEFAARGLSVVYLSYDDPADQDKFRLQKSIQGRFVSDTSSEVIDAFGLRNETHGPASFAYGVPHPVVFIIGNDKVIRAKLFEADFGSNKKSYQARPAVDVVLADADSVLP